MRRQGGGAKASSLASFVELRDVTMRFVFSLYSRRPPACPVFNLIFVVHVPPRARHALTLTHARTHARTREKECGGRGGERGGGGCARNKERPMSVVSHFFKARLLNLSPVTKEFLPPAWQACQNRCRCSEPAPGLLSAPLGAVTPASRLTIARFGAGPRAPSCASPCRSNVPRVCVGVSRHSRALSPAAGAEKLVELVGGVR